MDTVKHNQTEIREFLLLGFQNLPIFNYVLFILFLKIYMLTLISNLVIILLVAMVPSLKTPMYFLLTQLSLSDILLTTNISPNMLHGLINGGSSISVTDCLTQLGFHCVSSGVECFLLTMMSYDRYVAICDPLHYVTIMNHRLCLQMIICSWILSITLTCPIITLVSRLCFCGPYIIDHYFCDLGPLLELSCSDHATVFLVFLVDFVLAIPFLLFPFFFVFFTYISIFITIFSLSSTAERQKAYSTCSSHLIVVNTYYGTIIAVYMSPSEGHSLNFSKLMSLIYTVGIPCLNPIIYSLRNKKIKKASMKLTFLFPRYKQTV